MSLKDRIDPPVDLADGCSKGCAITMILCWIVVFFLSIYLPASFIKLLSR